MDDDQPKRGWALYQRYKALLLSIGNCDCDSCWDELSEMDQQVWDQLAAEVTY